MTALENFRGRYVWIMGDDDVPGGNALALSKTFDSFDATLRLAAMTDQTDDFRDYITATQKMRAYKGKIEGGTVPAPKAAPAREPRKESSAPKPVMRPAPAPAVPPAPEARETASPSPANGSGLLAVVAIVVLSIAAIGLAIALLLK